ncbi:MAG: nucleoside deaminase [Aquificae bacterium]|nr:nucleoside deaminase [Aquificota bacterium]
MEDKDFIQEAYKEALKSYSLGEVPVGAVVVLDGEIIGRGHNRRITQNNPLLHAEIVAIQEACQNIGNWRLDGATIYITNEPCLMCAGAILHSRIKKVVFASLNQKMGAVVSNYKVFDNQKSPYKVEYVYLPDERCGGILTDFFKGKRKGD